MRSLGAGAGLALLTLALAMVEALGAAGCSGGSTSAADAADAGAGDSADVAGDAATDAGEVAADASDTADTADSAVDANDTAVDANDTAVDAEPSDGGDASETSMPGEVGPGAGGCSQLCGLIDGLGCANPIPCLSTCQTNISTRCGDLYALWLACAVNRPASDFHCNAAGHGVLDEAQCEDQMFDYGDCLLGGP